jgi:molybdopterin molybdotransferase
MLKNPDFITARNLLVDAVSAVGLEEIPLAECVGRVLAEDVAAADNVPPFDRSPYDGYALRSEDVAGATKENPVTLYIVEEVPAGAVPTVACTKNTAVKILTGAPIPEGADCVINYERTEFTESSVKIFEPVKAGSNIVLTGEDVKKGDLLACKGQVIDAGTTGTLASQGIAFPKVYRRPKVGIISTGNEVSEVGEPLAPGKSTTPTAIPLLLLWSRSAVSRSIWGGLETVRKISAA